MGTVLWWNLKDKAKFRQMISWKISSEAFTTKHLLALLNHATFKIYSGDLVCLSNCKLSVHWYAGYSYQAHETD